MIRAPRLVIAVLLTVTLSPHAAALSETVRLGTLEWPPYVSQALPKGGYAAAVVREAFRRSGIRAEFTFLPWARVIHEAAMDHLDGYFPEYASKDRAETFAFSDPFSGGPLGFFALKSSAISYRSLPELVGYRIGTVRGYVNTEAFDTAKYLLVEQTANDLTNIRKLLAGRIDLMVADKYVGRYLARTHEPERADDLVFLNPVLEEKELFICIRRDSSRREALLNAFNRGLADMRADGSLDTIRAQYGFRD